MDKLDWKIRRFLVDEGYLFPQTDAEIERAIKECEAMKKKDLLQIIIVADVDVYAQLPFGEPGETVGDFLKSITADCLRYPESDIDQVFYGWFQKVGIELPKPETNLCCRCEKKQGSQPHECPFNSEVNNNKELCNCCDTCMSECKFDLLHH